MTQATQTTLGTIKLAGDLAGSNDANTPTLTSTGVTPGSYVFPTITVDGKGRITAATSGAPEDIADIIPGASKTQKGIARIGDNIEVTEVTTQGYYNIGYGGTLVGGADSGLEYDPCRPYTVSISSSGQNEVKISIVTGAGGATVNELITAFNSQLSWAALSLVSGNLRLVPSNTGAGSFITITNDCLFKYIDGYTGTITSDFGKDSNTIWVKEASVSDFGVIKVGYGLTISNGILSFDSNQINKATSSTLGIVKIGDGLTASGGVVSVDLSTVQLPIATNSVLGGVKIGSGLSVLGDGTISADLPLATTSTKGGVIVGSNINVSGGTISIPIASTSVKGVVKVGYGLTVDSNGVLAVNNTMMATTTTPGLVKIGSGLLVSNGVVSVNTSNLPSASKSAKGAVKIGSNIDVSAGVISVPVASSTVIGVSKIDTSVGFFITGDGYLSLTTAAITASPTQLGMVKIGSGISVSNGTISVTSPDATTSTKGIVQIGSGLSVSNGILTAPPATSMSLGVVKLGSGLTTDVNGNLIASVPTASTTIKGGVKIGDNIDVDMWGNISVGDASTTNYGVVKIGSGLSVTDGVVSLAPLTLATPSVAGVVKIGSGISITNDGTVSVPFATTTDAGVVKIGAGLSVTDGVVSVGSAIPNGSTTVKGLVQVGTGLSVTDGIISSNVPNGSPNTAGLVKLGTGIISDVTGLISLDTNVVPSRENNNMWEKAQIFKPYEENLSVAGTKYIQLLESNILNYTFTSSINTTLDFSNFTAVINGSTQNVTGTWTLNLMYGNLTPTIAWNSKFKFKDGITPPQLQAGASGQIKCRTFILHKISQQRIIVEDLGTTIIG